MKQSDFFSKTSKAFGGSLLKGANARSPRPVSSKNGLHIVMRSEIAKGPLSMRKHAKIIENIVRKQAKKWGVKIYRYANVGNHLHILVRPHSRRRYKGFIRAISGLIARTVLGAERGMAAGQKFWQARPFTRIIAWGKDFMQAKEYVDLNAREALGFLSPRKLRQLGLDTT